jgi:hypothetical protein
MSMRRTSCPAAFARSAYASAIARVRMLRACRESTSNLSQVFLLFAYTLVLFLYRQLNSPD